MYCPNCKQNFENGDFCPCCTDDNGAPMNLVPTPTEQEPDKNTEMQPREIDAHFLQEVQQLIQKEMGLEPDWLSRVDSFSITNSDGTCEEGCRLVYEDMRKKFGRKLLIEVDKSGKITRVITTK